MRVIRHFRNTKRALRRFVDGANSIKTSAWDAAMGLE
jgi:hypothetical protein